MSKCATILAMLLASMPALAAPPLEENFEKIYSLGANAEVRIQNTDGTIYLYGSEVNELKVYARKKAYSQARLEAIEIKVSIEGEKVNIDTIYPSTPKGLSLKDRSGTVDYTILLPQTCNLAQVALTNGEVIIAGMRGPAVNARLTNGIMSVSDCFSALRLRVAQGGLDVSFNWWEAGAVSLDSELGMGNVRLALPPDPSVQLDATTKSGSISNQFGQEYGQSDAHHLRTTIGAEGGPEFKIRTESGSIRIERSY